jgi:hypothetical protein
VRSTQSAILSLTHTRSVVAATRDQTDLLRFHGGEVVVWLGNWDAICPNTFAQSYRVDLRSYRRISSRLSRGEEATEERRFEQWDRLQGIYADIYQNLFV